MNKNNKNNKNTHFNCCDQSKQRVDGSWVNGSNGSVFWMGHIWVMGRCTFTHDPPAYFERHFMYERHFGAFNARHIIISQRNLLFPEPVEALSIVLEGCKKANCCSKLPWTHKLLNTSIGPLSSVYVSRSVTEIEHCCIFFWVFFYLWYIKHFLLFL